MTRLRDKISVEGLDDARVERIERRVLAAMSASRRPGPARPWWAPVRWLAPAVAVAGVALAMFLNWRAAQHMSGARAQARHVATSAAGTEVGLGHARVVIGAGARVSVDESPGGAVTVTLDHGRVDCDVTPRPARPVFRVRAGEVEVEVVGTAFAVERDQREVRVAVTRGKVRVRDARGERYLVAGESWSSSRGVLARARTPAARGDAAGEAGSPAAVDRARSAPASTMPGAPAVTSGAPTAPGPEIAAANGSAIAAPADPARTGQAAPDHARSHGATPGSDHTRDRARDQTRDVAATSRRPGGSGPDRSTPRRRALPRPPRHQPPGSTAATDRVLELALSIESNPADRRRAAEMYRKIARRRSDGVGSFALYSLAYLQHFHLGQTDAALVSVRTYEQRFPRGRELDDVLWLRVHARCARRASTDACRSALRRYLERVPAGRYHETAENLLTR